MTISLLFLVMIAALLASLIVANDHRVKIFCWRIPTALGLVLLVTGSLSTLQFAYPAILTSLRRNRHELVEGQVWRLVSPLFVQDGGWAGTISNLVWLFLLGSAAIALLGARHWLVLYFGTGVIAEVLAYTLVHQGFAGNSIANFGVAAGLLLLAVRSPRRRAVAFGVVGLLGGLGLLTLGNLHGAAFVVGLIISLLWDRLSGEGLVAIRLRSTSRSSLTTPSSASVTKAHGGSGRAAD